MRIVATGEGERPPVGTPVEVEVRDVTELDAPAIALANARSSVDEAAGDDDSGLTVVELDVPDDALDPARDVTVWARVGASGEARTGRGDWITMQSFPVRTAVDDGGGQLDVEVRLIP